MTRRTAALEGRRAPGRHGSGLAAPVAEFAAFVIDRLDRRLRKHGARRAEGDARGSAIRCASRPRSCATPPSSSRRSIPKKRVAPYLEALENLQDILGALNDAVVVDRLLAEVVAATGRPTAPGIDGLVRGWIAAVAQHELAGFKRAWDEFEEAKPFWE